MKDSKEKYDIDKLREAIDDIDSQIIELFEKRMDVSKKVGLYKRQNDLPIFVPDREQEILNNKVKLLKNKELEPYCLDFFQNLMDVSKDLQKKIVFDDMELVVAYTGIPGAYGEQAAINSFKGKRVKTLPCDSFENAFICVANMKAEYAVVPIENTTGGSIDEIYNLLDKYKCFIVGEYILKVENSLLGIKGAKIEDIKRVYSHAQPFLQCSDFIKTNEFETVEQVNTAVSAKYVASLNDISCGAIANARNAEIYGLETIAENINNKKINMTRFVIIGRDIDFKANKAKASIAFSLKHECGSLHSLLSYIAKKGLSLTKLESRNVPEKPFEYRFYIDFEGVIRGEDLKQLIDELKALTVNIELLGYYNPYSE